MVDKTPIHPNSLANLKPKWTRESALKAQANSVIARKANKEARESLKMTMNEWKKYKTEVLDDTDMSSIDVLKILMMKALENDDFDQAADLAKSLAEFEAPKLARIEQTNTDVTTEDMTDEELNAKIKEMMNGENDSSKDT